MKKISINKRAASKRLVSKTIVSMTLVPLAFVYLMGFVGVGVLCSNASYAHTALNPTQVLEFSISKGGLTRISIDNDGIEDIYAYPTEYADNISHHKSGHIFIVADDLERPLYVTLITKRGAAQDLKLIPKSKKAEPIILRYEASQDDNEETRQQQIQEQANTVLGSFVQGIIPAGFYVISTDEVSRGHACQGKGELEAVVENAYQNERYRVLVFKVKNDSGDKITLDNRVLWEKRDLASAFDQSHLNAGGSGKLYVIQKR